MKERVISIICFLSIEIHAKQVFDISIPLRYNFNMVESVFHAIIREKGGKEYAATAHQPADSHF